MNSVVLASKLFLSRSNNGVEVANLVIHNGMVKDRESDLAPLKLLTEAVENHMLHSLGLTTLKRASSLIAPFFLIDPL